jgi:hypothetical protein
VTFFRDIWEDTMPSFRREIIKHFALRSILSLFVLHLSLDDICPSVQMPISRIFYDISPSTALP